MVTSLHTHLRRHLRQLEAEAITILREVVATRERPVLLYSIGKDSATLLHLARKAFHPAPLPCPLLHIDTGWKFREMIAFRDATVRQFDLTLIAHTNADGAAQKVSPFTHGSARYTDVMKSEALRQALDHHRFDAAIGGARRDEERSRAKERIFSVRAPGQRWDPKRQRPELWSLFNTELAPGETLRVFPLSNWTELDVWTYIAAEHIPVVPLYFAAEREVVARDGLLLIRDDDRMVLQPGETVRREQVRFRTLGCWPLTGAIRSGATDVAALIDELRHSRVSERHGRAIDHDSTASMEKKKHEGYF